MLWLARAWKVQYQGGEAFGSGSGSGHEAGIVSGRGKTRAEKDREVAEFLNKHGVNRDAKTAGTKWDNMLGEFRKVYEWERGGEREQIGKSYFRLSPYERKIHRLPASFDEEVFEELSQFMGPKMRPSSHILHHHHHQQQHGLRSLITPSNLNIPSDLNLRNLPPPPPFRDQEDFPLSGGRTRQMESYMMQHNPRSALLGLDPHPLLDVGMSPLSSTSGGSSRVELRRIGKMRMTWEESVSLWAEEGEYHRGRVKVQGSSLLDADELVYFDDSMVACTLEAFEEGPLKGFSIDRFFSGQQLKVFGRKKTLISSSFTPAQTPGFSERIPFPMPEPSSRWEFQDPTEYHLSCLRVPPATLPSLVELSWYIKEPPLEEFRLPLRKDIYRDLPQGKELFFTTSSNDSLLDCKSFTVDILSSIIRSTPSLSASTSTCRDSFIPLWDDCINRVISKFCPLETSFIRKQPKSPVSIPLQDQWPSITGMVRNLCLWRGEEIHQRRSDQSQPLDYHPSSTITEKISWTCHDLPYVLGYYAIGHNVTFCALSPSTPQSTQDQTRVARTDLHSLDLSNPSERLKAIVPCWRIAVLLAALAEKCPHGYSDFEREDLGNGNYIEMTPNTVTKFYPGRRKWQEVKEIHEVLDRRVPHAEQIHSQDDKDLALVFKPRGVKTKPKSYEELILALKQVTTALVALHDLSFMHRDLSWEKVMAVRREVGDEREWFVAGFEEAVAAPQINPWRGDGSSLEGGRHAPEMGRGVHGVKVDVWGVGYLIRTSGLVGPNEVEEAAAVVKQMRELERRCMEQNPEQRPTAADCYHHLLQIQSSATAAAAAAKGGSTY